MSEKLMGLKYLKLGEKGDEIQNDRPVNETINRRM